MIYNINYASVLVATVVAFLAGWAWYGPLFGKQWMAMMGYTKDSIRSMKMKPTTSMVLGFISNLVMAKVLAIFVQLFGATDFSGAVALTFWVWLGFVATVLAGTVLWENKSVKLYVFNIAYHFVIILIMTTILALWR